MSNQYVEQINGAYRVAGSRVSLDSIVYGFWNGESPETIAQSFPTLTLKQVYGAITFYLEHEAEIDEYISQGEIEFEKLRDKARQSDPMFYQKLANARKNMKTPAL
ncbi:MAG: DUF433 domain-containing protein [Acidobacteriota bacterium]